MDFKKGWGIIERLLLIVGVIGSILNLASGFSEFFVPNESRSGIPADAPVVPLILRSIILGGIVWAPYLGARIIGWIAKNLIRKRQEELK